jgi:hypothetical protein
MGRRDDSAAIPIAEVTCACACDGFVVDFAGAVELL